MKARLNQRIPNLKLKICACGGCYSIGFGTCGGKKQAWAGVVHYWEHDEPGWYMSTANGDIRVEPTHWQEISELDGPNFPRTSQNKTVSSGVEGAHEENWPNAKRDAKKRAIAEAESDALAGSREPEKLNNAQLDTRRVIPAGLRRYSWAELQAMENGPNKRFVCEECDGCQVVSSGPHHFVCHICWSELLPTQLPKEK
jgi:hypothetical protein